MITFSNVSKVYTNDVVGLDNVSFHIDKGEFVFLVGQSGAGKSSVIKLLMCEETPTAGEITLGDTVITRLKRRQIPYLRRSIGVVFQDFRLLPKKTVYENVAFAMEIIGAPTKQIRHQVPAVLNLVGLADRARSYPNQLSGGEQQRVSLARALINNPTLLIADEPTGNLDNETAQEIMVLLDNINKRGTTVLMATHAEKIVNEMKKRVITLEDGVLVRDQERGVYSIGS